jgi:translation initiation factor 2 beta subunit (eIF-2beta)/eIF-5
MPAIKTSKEKKKTICENILSVADSIYRTPNEIMKYFSIVFGCATSFSSERYMLNAPLTSEQLQDKLQEYIEIFILCEQCDLPETHYVFDKKLTKRCYSCSHESIINHKLCKYLEKEISENKYHPKNSFNKFSSSVGI